MKAFKRLLSLLVIIMIAFSVIACSNSSETEKDGTSEQSSGAEGTKANEDTKAGTDSNMETNAGLPEKLENPDLKMVYWYDNEDMKNAIKQFEEKYGGKVEVVMTTWEEMEKKIVSMISSGDSPDYFYFPDWRMPTLAIKNLLMPVDNYIDLKDPYISEENMKSAFWKGKYYGLAPKAEAQIVFYNKRLFESNGVKTPLEYYNEGAWNWDAFAEVAKELTQDTNNDGTIDQWGYNSYQYQLLFQSNDAYLTKIEDDGNINVTAKDPKVTEVLNFYQNMYSGPNKFANTDQSRWDKDFVEGVSAMTSGGYWMAELHFKGKMKDEFDFVPFPAGPSAAKDYIAGGMTDYVGIPVGAKNPEGLIALYKIYSDVMKEKREENPDPVWTTEQIERMKEYGKLSTYSKSICIGGINPFSILNPLIGGKPAASAVEAYAPKMQAIIDDIIKEASK